MGQATLHKKIRKLYRQDVRAKLGMETTLFDRLMRERPRYMPLWLWAQLARLFFTPQWRPHIVAFKGRIKAKPKTRQNEPVKPIAITTEELPAHDGIKAG